MFHLVFGKESDLVLVRRQQPREGSLHEFLLGEQDEVDETFGIILTGVTKRSFVRGASDERSRLICGKVRSFRKRRTSKQSEKRATYLVIEK